MEKVIKKFLEMKHKKKLKINLKIYINNNFENKIYSFKKSYKYHE